MGAPFRGHASVGSNVNDNWHSNSCGEYDEEYGYHQGRFPRARVGNVTTTVNNDDYTSGPKISSGRATRVVPVDLRSSVKETAPLLRNFRENGCYTLSAYRNLLERMCSTCKIPPYKQNRPTFTFSEEGPTNERGVFLCKDSSKILKLYRLGDIRAFIMLWFLYLESRNTGFFPKGEEEISGSFAYRPCMKRAKAYCKEAMEKSEPQQVRNLKTRSYVDVREI